MSDYLKNRDTEKKCVTHPSKPSMSPIVPTVKSSITYIPSGVAGVDEVHPVLNGAPVRVNERKVDRRITVRLPWHIEEMVPAM